MNSRRIFRLSILLMVTGMVCACPKPAPPKASSPSTVEIDWSKRDTDAVKAAAISGTAAAQRELAGRLIFGQGMPQDIPAALVWTEKAAYGGDAQAALWMGRKFLSEEDRIRSAAWFLVAVEAGQPGFAQDAHAELEALAPTPEELATARTLSAEWKQDLISPPPDTSK